MLRNSLIAFLVAFAIPTTAVRAQSDAPVIQLGSMPDMPSVPVRGVVRALDQAALSIDMVVPVKKIGFRVGQSFKKGDLLISFKCKRYRAEAQAAKSVWDEMRLTLDSNRKLEKFSAVGRHDVDISKARVNKAAAEARAAESRVDQCDIHAPFDGRVADLDVHVHELPETNKPFMKIVGVKNVTIELIVPSNWLSWLSEGAEFKYKIDETNRVYTAKVVRLGATVDPVSQMISVIAVFQEPAEDVLPGMSGAAAFSQPQG